NHGLRPSPALVPARPTVLPVLRPSYRHASTRLAARLPPPALTAPDALPSLPTSPRHKPTTISPRWHTNSKRLCGAQRCRKADRRSLTRWLREARVPTYTE